MKEGRMIMKILPPKKPEFYVAAIIAIITTINPGAGIILALVLSIPLLNIWEWVWGGVLCGLGISGVIALINLFI